MHGTSIPPPNVHFPSAASRGCLVASASSFKKCGLSVALDGSENAQVSIDGIPNCEMPQRFVGEEFKLLDDDHRQL